MKKAVSWTDDAYWAAWNKWDEVIEWGDEEESSPTTLPSNQASSCNGDLEAGIVETDVLDSLQMYYRSKKKNGRQTRNQTPAEVGLSGPKVECLKLHQVEVAEVEGGKVIIKAMDDKILRIEALDVDIGLIELQELIEGDATFDIAEVEISNVIVEVTENEGLETKVQVEVTEVKVVNCDGCPMNDVAVEVCDLKMEDVQIRQDDLHENDSGKVKVATLGGNVMEVPLRTTSTRRQKKRRRS